MRFSLKRVVTVIAVITVALLLVLVGRNERTHERREMLNGIAAVRNAIGPSLIHPGPTDYIEAPTRTCLLYAAGQRSYALELCIDGIGRVIEATDRRGKTVKIYSIESEPGIATFHIAPQLVSRLIVKIQKAVSP